MRTGKRSKKYGAKTRTINLGRYLDWPDKGPRGTWWSGLKKGLKDFPVGNQTSWGIPFKMAQGKKPRSIMLTLRKEEITVPVGAKCNYVCILHQWYQKPEEIKTKDPSEGLVVGEYTLCYSDKSRHTQLVRARFEVAMIESPGPTWLSSSFNMPEADDPARVPDCNWGHLQNGVKRGPPGPGHYAMSNPYPEKQIVSVKFKGLKDSPLLVWGMTFFQGTSHPLRHLPRRKYRIKKKGSGPKVKKAAVDLGVVNRIETVDMSRSKKWLDSQYAGLNEREPRKEEDVLSITAGNDATLSVELEDKKAPLEFSIGEAFHKGKSEAGGASLEILDRHHQWMQIRVTDGSTGRPTPVRIHFSGSRGEYIAPYGHHDQINANWFEDYGADVIVGGKNFAYVQGEFTSDMPVGDVYVEIYKGFEYQPVRTKVTIKPGQKLLNLKLNRWKDLRSKGWVTADTHVHFISPHTAWLEGECEGVNVINLLASQWGRLFTNVGDIIGKPNVVENDTIVFVGTENRNHMLGHMSMLGTKDLPVYPMCCGGVGESWIGDPDFLMLAEWAAENKRKGGVVIRPHYPYCGFTEDPVPILKGLVDALEIGGLRGTDFPTQEWYRYLNCGYKVAVAGGTDKMGAYCALGHLRTYAKLDPNRPFTYDNWGKAVRAGRTCSTNGPLIDMHVDGKHIGETIVMGSNGGTVEVRASAECFAPLGRLEIVQNGRVVADTRTTKGSKKLSLKKKLEIGTSGWIAARCTGHNRHPSSYMAAHTSPVYLKVGHTRAFDNAAAEHMLALVEGGREYINTLAVNYDEQSRRRMVKLFNEVRRELKGRLIVEGGHTHHHNNGLYHHHGHGGKADHSH